jgi:hypothetical protein
MDWHCQLNIDQLILSNALTDMTKRGEERREETNRKTLDLQKKDIQVVLAWIVHISSHGCILVILLALVALDPQVGSLSIRDGRRRAHYLTPADCLS